jgi:hypothetical protein
MKWTRFRWRKVQQSLPDKATVALIISAIQAIFSFPLLTEFYFRPDLVVSGPPLRWSESFTHEIAWHTKSISGNGNTSTTSETGA